MIPIPTNNETDQAPSRPTQGCDIAEVREHYEQYPYPYIPEARFQDSVVLMGESLGELNHWLFKGKEDFRSGFRCLIAGGGTGNATLFLAEQLKHADAEIVYLDFSKSSMEIARKRAEMRGLTNITWYYDSIYNIPKLDLGKFDYISCTGVLHHLPSPPEGLKILRDLLTSKGGMHIMVYGTYGRTGIYQMQDLMRMVNEGTAHNQQEEVRNAKVVLNALPQSNWLIKGKELINDLSTMGDVGIYDLFLHKQDRSYSVPELYEFIEGAGLHFVDFLIPIVRISFNVENYIKDEALLSELKSKDIRTQQAICELILGAIKTHDFWVSNQKDTVASIEDINNVMSFYLAENIPQKIYDQLEKSLSHTGSCLTFQVSTPLIENLSISVPISNISRFIFKYLDGSRTIGDIFSAVRQELKQDIDNHALLDVLKEIARPLLTGGIMLLRNKSVVSP